MNLFPNASVQDVISIGLRNLYLPQGAFSFTALGDVAGAYKILKGCNSDGVTARAGAGLGDYLSRKAAAGGKGYQVPVGLSLRILAIRWSTKTAGAYWQLAYSDVDSNPCAGGNSALTNGVYELGTSAADAYIAPTAGTFDELSAGFIIPASKFVEMQASNDAMVTVIAQLF